MTRLHSSAIRAVDYDPATGRLVIEFHSTGRYTFHRVPLNVYLGLINAASPGSYYNRHIRGRYH